MKLVESFGMSHDTSTAHKHVVKNFRTRNEIRKVLEISIPLFFFYRTFSNEHGRYSSQVGTCL